MTEQEAIEIINDVTWKDFGRHPDFPKARDMAISALEKIQQYREIGSVEDYKRLKRLEKEIDLERVVRIQRIDNPRMNRAVFEVDYCVLLGASNVDIFIREEIKRLVDKNYNAREGEDL